VLKDESPSLLQGKLLELLRLEGATSRVWDYFGFTAQNGKFLQQDKKKRKKVNCKLCARDFSYVGNTTNMWQHLKESHPGHFREAKSDESSPRCARANTFSKITVA